jgi:hypothetical protein
MGDVQQVTLFPHRKCRGQGGPEKESPTEHQFVLPEQLVYHVYCEYAVALSTSV